MLELYAFPNTYAMGCQLLLEESSASYEVIDINQFDSLPGAAREKAIDDFKKASPHQRVPALKMSTGEAICESGAIALYLADTLDDGKFSIPANSVDRAEYMQWLFYFSSTLQPEVMLQFHPEYYFDDSILQQHLKQAAHQRLSNIWPVLEQRYAHVDTETPWMFENRPTAVDFSLLPVLVWPESFPGVIDDYPSLRKLLSAMCERDTCREVLKWHKIEL